MSCSAPSKLLSYYSNKVNIYNNDCYIRLPDWNSCPPPAQIYMVPEYVYPSPGPYVPPVIVPGEIPLYNAGELCGNTQGSCGGAEPCGPCGGNTSTPCGPCGNTSTPCGPCGR